MRYSRDWQRSHIITAVLIALAVVLCYVRTLWCG
jgi:hypothetical protein